MSTPQPAHAFVPYPGGRYPNSCVRCGKAKDNPVHADYADSVKQGFQESLSLLAAATDPLVGSIPMDEVARQHSTYVQIKQTGGFFASCMLCGAEPYLFPDRDTLVEAEADAKMHGELRHNYSRRTLEQHEELTQAMKEQHERERQGNPSST